ncbi:MAG: hypothetical protein ACE14S_00890 [Candidatus Bathyarchaeia archaeon]
MYTTDIEKIREQLSTILSVIEEPYITALLSLHRKLARQNFPWALTGALGEALKTVQVKPDCLEIVTTQRGAAQIFLAVQDCNPTGVYFQTHKLDRNAVVEGKEYPVYVRSYYFDFTINGVKAKVYGDLQFRISNWSWGDKLEFEPEHVFVAGTKTAIVPLALKHDLYQHLGWTDRAEKIRQVLVKAPVARGKVMVNACAEPA